MTPGAKHQVNLDKIVQGVMARGAEVMIRINLYDAIGGMIERGIVSLDGEHTSMRMWEIGHCVWAFYNSASRDGYLFTGNLDNGNVVYEKVN
ncbi:MAG: hypothetical protein V1729_05250 [Candidatus Woesearchaeota archaeon]